jgi:hypothetical protein
VVQNGLIEPILKRKNLSLISIHIKPQLRVVIAPQITVSCRQGPPSNSAIMHNRPDLSPQIKLVAPAFETCRWTRPHRLKGVKTGARKRE